MKIALVSPYDFAYPGGVGNHVSALARQLTLMGHEVSIIAPASQAVSPSGGRFTPVGRPWPYPGSGSVARVTFTPWLSSQLKPIFDRERFDIVHYHEPLCPTLCTSALRISRAANVGTFHAVDSRSYGFLRPFTAPYLRGLFSRLDGRIAVSRAAMEFIHKYFPADYTIIPNGVDLAHFSPDVAPVDEFKDDRLNVLFVGRLEKRKGVNYLLEAFALARQQVPGARLIVVGPGTRWGNKLKKRVERGRLADTTFVGYASYEELPRYYQTADIVCFPATGRESFGIVLLEAMALGKPVVATNLPGYASVVTHGSEGLLVPPKNSRELAAALITLMTDARLRSEMGARGRAKSRDYDWPLVARRVVGYYNEVLNGCSQGKE